MEHFAVIQSICRIGLTDKNEKFRKQVERLRDRLKKDGNTKQAAVLDSLLTADTRQNELVPSKVELSKAIFSKEKLSTSVIPPHDRESSAPLVEIITEFAEWKTPPVLQQATLNALNALANEWQNSSALQKLQLSPSTSCLIFGPPGTGKTLAAHYLAARLGTPLVTAKIDGLISSFLGTTARNLAQIFEFANRYNCVLLLDEFDAIAKLRNDPNEVGEIKRVVNTLLQNLDSRRHHGLTLATTNHPELLDNAVWRRFETRLEFPKPPLSLREELVEHFLPPLDPPLVFRKLLYWLSEGTSGADIETMTKSIKRHLALSQSDSSTNTLWQAAEAYAARNANMDSHSKTNTLLLDKSEIANTLINSTDIRFTQKEVGELLQKDQATISRWVSGHKSEVKP